MDLQEVDGVCRCVVYAFVAPESAGNDRFQIILIFIWTIRTEKKSFFGKIVEVPAQHVPEMGVEGSPAQFRKFPAAIVPGFPVNNDMGIYAAQLT